MLESRKPGYPYSALDLDEPQIRLVTLQPGGWSDRIRCTIHVVPFDGQQAYEALSYVWGSPDQVRPISLNGHVFQVTENLWLALRRLRDAAAPRVLWIDAMCINQRDGGEKSSQVAMMGEIYKGCANCVIWLGEDDDDERPGPGVQSATAVRAFELLDVLATTDRHLPDLPCFAEEAGQRTAISGKYEDHFVALKQLLDRPWWRRIWVIQELALPPRVEFVYASEALSYAVLRGVVDMLRTHAATCCKMHRMSLRALAFDRLLVIQEQVDPIVSTREKWSRRESTTLFQLRRQFYAFQATEKRDLFYGLLGLVTDWGASKPLRPNYGCTPRAAITEAVFRCISEQGGMGFLLGGRLFRAPDNPDIPNLPSWVPDAYFCSIPSQWVMVEQRRIILSSSFAASGSREQPASELALGKDEVLFAQTLMVDRIAQVGSVCDALENWSKAPDVLRQWMEMVDIGLRDWPEQPPEEGSLMDAFWRTLVCNSTETDTATLSYRTAGGQDYAELRSLWYFFLDISPFLPIWGLSFTIESHDALQSKASKTLYHILVCIWQRRLFLTERGSVGLAPRDACVGDEVHIILGASSPFFLRSIGEESGNEDKGHMFPSYTIIGNGYLHGKMSGEALSDETQGGARTIAIY
ncbi:heterokaryon incompatibility protein-domain-containing protein [Biscogniauxia sp. FL1348]|nr:heterokaryon incompatibility protein-domain-containing protein [Biscogniauxia sp. FL1348]